MKKSVFTVLINLLIWSCIISYADEIIISSHPLSITYLVNYSSLTASNKTTLKNILTNTGGSHYWQPSGRFFEVYNSTRSVCFTNDYTYGDIKYDVTTKRMLITIDADYDNTIQPWITSSKIKRKSCLWEVITKDNITGKIHYRVVTEEYFQYDILPDNKDWCLKTYIVDTSTPIK